MTKVLISLEAGLLRKVDRAAWAQGLSRSAYLARLAERDAARTFGPGASPTARRAMERLEHLFESSPPGDSTAIVRAERDGLIAYDAAYVALAEADSARLVTDDARILALAPGIAIALSAAKEAFDSTPREQSPGE